MWSFEWSYTGVEWQQSIQKSEYVSEAAQWAGDWCEVNAINDQIVMVRLKEIKD